MEKYLIGKKTEILMRMKDCGLTLFVSVWAQGLDPMMCFDCYSCRKVFLKASKLTPSQNKIGAVLCPGFVLLQIKLVREFQYTEGKVE